MPKLTQAATVAAAHVVARTDATRQLLEMITMAAGDLADGDAASVQHGAEAIQAGAVRVISEALNLHREAAHLAGMASAAEGGAS